MQTPSVLSRRKIAAPFSDISYQCEGGSLRWFVLITTSSRWVGRKSWFSTTTQFSTSLSCAGTRAESRGDVCPRHSATRSWRRSLTDGHRLGSTSYPFYRPRAAQTEKAFQIAIWQRHQLTIWERTVRARGGGFVRRAAYFEQYQKERLCSHELRNWRLATPEARVCNALPAAIRCRYSDLLIRIAAFDIYNLRRASRSTYMCFHKSKRLVVDAPSVGLRDARDPVASIRNR
jgi:hypothetical protein